MKFQHMLSSSLLVIGLATSPADYARSDSIVAEGDIVGDGVSLQAIKDTLCQHLDSVHGISPLPALCVPGMGERFFFATSTGSSAGGNLVQWANDLLNPVTFTDGLVAGDAICQKHADDAGLPGSYTAWLSTDTVHAKDRIGDYTYISQNGNIVASSKAELLSCEPPYSLNSCLQSTIKSEYGTTPLSNGHWTGTYEDGTSDRNGTAGKGHCANWTSTTGSSWEGSPHATNHSWTIDIGQPCSIDGRGIVCIQD